MLWFTGVVTSHQTWTVLVQRLSAEKGWEVVAAGEWVEGRDPVVVGQPLPHGLLQTFANAHPPGFAPENTDGGTWPATLINGSYVVAYRRSSTKGASQAGS